MKLFTLVLFLAALFPVTVRAADTNPPPRLTLELRDGSRVVGTSVEDNLKFHSALLGDLKLAVKDIRSVESVSTNTAKLITANNDTLTVVFLDTRFKILTGFGKVELAADQVKRISVANLPATGSHDGLVLFWSGDGDTKNNVGTDPDTAARLDADNPVMIRSNPALISMQETRQLTFEAWIKPHSIPHEFPVLLSKGGNQRPKAYGGYELILNWNGDHDLSFISSAYDFATDSGWVNQHLGEWIHVAFTVDDKSKAASFYVNGVPTNDGINHGSNEDLNFATSNNLYIGSPDPASHPNRTRFDGEMRDVTLYNRVLTAEEIRADFESKKPSNTPMKLFTLVLFLGVALPLAVHADDTNTPPKLTIELRDGSRVMGTSVESSLRFHSGLLGGLKLAVPDIRSVDCIATNSAKLTTAGGDILTVEFAESELALKTSFGKISLPVDSLRRLSVSAAARSGRRDGLVAFWSGQNEGHDEAGSHDAQVAPGIKISPDTGFTFDGRANRIIVPNAEDLNFGAGQDFSIEAWIQPLLPPPFPTDDIMSIVDKRVTPNSLQCHGYEFNLYQGRLNCRLSDSPGGNGNFWCESGPDLRDGKFHHVAVSVQRGSTDGGKLFVDGETVMTFDPTSVPGDLTSGSPLLIGNHSDPGYRCYFKGVIREAGVYRRALSADEIRSIYTDEKSSMPPERVLMNDSHIIRNSFQE